MKKIKIWLSGLVVILSVSVLGFGSVNVNALAYGDVTPWQTSVNTLPTNVRAAGSTAYEGYMYVVGGDDTDGASNDVYYTQLNNDGTVGVWQSATQLPDSFLESTVAAYDGYLYVMGGYGSGTKNTVYYAPINNDGSLGSWSNGNTLPYSSNAATGFAHNGYLYYLGGVNFGTMYNNVSYAQINNDGSIGTWSSSGAAMPDVRFRASSFVAGNRIYVLGGQNDSSNQSSVFYANINNDGTTGAWTESPNQLPQLLRAGGAVYNNGIAYFLAGNNGSSVVSSVYYAQVNENGTTGAWKTATNALPVGLDATMVVTSGSYLYVAGGANSVGDKLDTVYSAQVTPYDADADDDADGIPNGVESGAPNNGDTNNDGIPDAEQSNVASFISPVTGKYVSLALYNEGPVCDIISVGIANESANSAQDSGYVYNLGMLSFTANCESEGIGNLVSIQYFDEQYNEDYIIRKYNPNTQEYFSMSEEDGYIDYSVDDDDNSILEISYFVEDGGMFDSDGLENGTIIDPVGLALISSQDSGGGFGPGAGNNDTSQSGGSLASTGDNTNTLLYIVLVALSLGMVLYQQSRRTTA